MFRNLPKFEYLSPGSIEEAVSLLARYGPRAKVLAGGTDLIPRMKWGEMRSECVLGISQIPDLAGLEFHSSTGLRLGASSRIGEIERSQIIREHYPILAQAASVLGSTEIRNRGTVGGNLCNGAPSADMAPSLLALDARAVIASEKGERTIPLQNFFVGPGKTVLADDELLVWLEVPPVKPDSAGEYIKLATRKAMDIAVVGVAALITRNSENRCEEARLALGAVAPTPIRAREAEGVLKGKALDREVIEQAARTASREASPITDIRASEEYRREMIYVLTHRAIQQALDKIES